MSNKPRSIVIVGPAWIGDMVMAQTLFMLLKSRAQVTIDLIAPKHSGSIATRMPEINQVLDLPIGHGEWALKKRWDIAQHLKQSHYDQAIVLPNSWKSGLLPWFAGIPTRTGWLGEARVGLLNDWRVLDKAAYPLMIQRFAALAYPPKHTLSTRLPWPSLKADHSQALRLKQAHAISEQGKPMIALCPGAEYGPAKRWPAHYYAQVAEQLLSQGWDVCLLGSPKEAAEAEVIMNATANRCINLIGKTSLVEAVDIMSLASGVVCNDSGLMHVAAALGVPTVAIYGSSSTAFTPPLSDKVTMMHLHLPCSPCFKRECPLGHLRCLKDIKPDRVLKAITAWKNPDARTNH